MKQLPSYILANRFWIHYLKNYKKGGKLLDVGCGFAFFLQRAEKDFSVWGIDTEKSCVIQSKRRCKKAEINMGDVRSLSHYNNDFFDIVTAFDVLEHVDYPSKAFLEINRVLKNGGLFVMITPNIDSFGRKLMKKKWYGFINKTHISLLPPNDWLTLVTSSGFKVVDVFCTGFLQHRLLSAILLIPFSLGFKFPLNGEGLCIVSFKENPGIKADFPKLNCMLPIKRKNP